MQSRAVCRVLCLCVVVIGLMGFGAGAAHASTWMVSGTNLTSGEKAVNGKLAGISFTLFLTRIAGIHVKLLCKVGIWKFLKLLITGKLSPGAILRLTQCNIVLKTKKEEELGEAGKVSGPCEPFVGAEKGVFETNKLKGQLAEHTSGEGVIRLEAESGETLGVVHMGEECAIGEEIPLIGKLALVDSGGMAGLLTEAKVHKVKEGPLTEMWAISKTAEHKATTEGEMELALESGEVWNGLLP